MRIEIAFFMLLALAAPVRGDTETLAYSTLQDCRAPEELEGKCLLLVALDEELTWLKDSGGYDRNGIAEHIIDVLIEHGDYETVLPALWRYLDLLQQRRGNLDGETKQQMSDRVDWLRKVVANKAEDDEDYRALLDRIVAETERGRLPEPTTPHDESDAVKGWDRQELVARFARRTSGLARLVEPARLRLAEGDPEPLLALADAAAASAHPFEGVGALAILLAQIGEMEKAKGLLNRANKAIAAREYNKEGERQCAIYWLRGYGDDYLRALLVLGDRQNRDIFLKALVEHLALPGLCEHWTDELEIFVELLVEAKLYGQAFKLIEAAHQGPEWSYVRRRYHRNDAAYLRMLQAMELAGYDTARAASKFEWITVPGSYRWSLATIAEHLKDTEGDLGAAALQVLEIVEPELEDLEWLPRASTIMEKPSELKEIQSETERHGVEAIARALYFLERDGDVQAVSQKLAEFILRDRPEQARLSGEALDLALAQLYLVALDVIEGPVQQDFRTVVLAYVAMHLDHSLSWPLPKFRPPRISEAFDTTTDLCLAQRPYNRALSPAVLERAPFCGALAE